MSIFDRPLPEPDFIERDAAKITREQIAYYEQLTGKKLYPAQVERLQINNAAYRESLLREAVQDAAKQNLLRYARYPILDMHGERVGVIRLDARPAITTVRVTFKTAPTSAVVIPSDTLFLAGQVSFAPASAITVATGAKSIDIDVICSEAGKVGNGFTAGQISGLAAPIGGLDVASVSNLTVTSAGAEAEDDDHLRERIALAPQAFSNAGSEGAYKFWAMTAHQDIIDVAVRGPELNMNGGQLISTNDVPIGCVYLYPLTKNGLPTPAIRALVAQACNQSKVRPITDYVQVFDPIVYDYRIVARLTPYKATDLPLVESTAELAAVEYARATSAQLGVDVVRVQIEKALQTYGVKDVELQLPTTNGVIEPHGWARCVLIDVSLKNAEDV